MRSLAPVGRVMLFLGITLGVIVIEGAIVVLGSRIAGRPLHLASGTTSLHASALLEAEIACVIAVTTATALMARRERRAFADYGLAWRTLFGAPFWTGTLAGLASAAAVIGAMVAVGSARISTGPGSSGPFVISAHAAAWALAFLSVALFEDQLFRGYAQVTLARAFGFRVAAIVLSLADAAMHAGNVGESALGTGGVFAVAILCAFAVWRFGDLRWVIGFHAAWDWTQTGLFGTADSGLAASGSILHTTTSGPAALGGGTIGPEATIFVPFVVAIVALIIARRVPRPVRETTWRR